MKLKQIFSQFYKNKIIFSCTKLSMYFHGTNKLTTDKIISKNNFFEFKVKYQKKFQNAVCKESRISSITSRFLTTYPREVTKSNAVFAPFINLLRRSNFMHLGDPEEKVVIGKIIEIVNNDLYIDFGWKFCCVCSRPIKNHSDFIRGAKVYLKIKNLELSTKFLGASKDITILEADCILLGFMSSPNKIDKIENSQANLQL